MPLEDILRKIDEKADHLKEEIISAAQTQAESKLKSAAETASMLEASILEEARERAARIESIAVSRAEMNKKQMLLEAKQQLISDTLREVLEEFRNMPQEQYRELLLDWISLRAQGTEMVIVSEWERESLGDDFLEAANERLREIDKEGNLTISYSPEYLGGGIILKKGGISDNLTFPAILNFMKEDLELEVATILFGRTQEKESAS